MTLFKLALSDAASDNHLALGVFSTGGLSESGFALIASDVYHHSSI